MEEVRAEALAAVLAHHLDIDTGAAFSGLLTVVALEGRTVWRLIETGRGSRIRVPPDPPLGQLHVDHRAQKHRIGLQIQPHDQRNYRAKAAIHLIVIGEMREVIGEPGRANYPPKRGNNREVGDLETARSFQVTGTSPLDRRKPPHNRHQRDCPAQEVQRQLRH